MRTRTQTALLWVLIFALALCGLLVRPMIERGRCETLATLNAPIRYQWHLTTGCMMQLQTGKWVYALPAYGGD